MEDPKGKEGRSERPKEAKKNDGRADADGRTGLLGLMSKKKPNEVCLQFARSLSFLLLALEEDHVPFSDYVTGWARSGRVMVVA